ncbi:MAG: LacI family DNA-binding transcriptional regulator [Marinosulfonomonas sp.]
MAKLSDVAARAGVSNTTVSRYLNNKITLPQATRDRIDKAVKALNYRPNLLAQRLSKGRAHAICLVTPDIANPFFAELAAVIEAKAALHGYSVYIVATHGEKEKEIEAFSNLENQHADGLIFATSQTDCSHLYRLLQEHRNVILLDEAIPETQTGTIVVDNVQGAYLGTSHLIGLGHHDIAFVGGPPKIHSGAGRLEGFHKAMAEAKLPINPDFVLCHEYTETFGFQAGQLLLALEKRPSAIMAASDFLVFGLLRALKANGVRVPQDISIVGFDDIPFVDLINPALTTIHQPIQDLGGAAVNNLIALLEGGTSTGQICLPVELIQRSSTQPFEASTK